MSKLVFLLTTAKCKSYCISISIKYTDLAKESKGEDEEGYRSEFIKLVKIAESLTQKLSSVE